MALADVETLLQAAMGLSVASIGSAPIARAVRERQAICKLGDLPAYLDRLRRSATELQALIEAVVVPETWFFRDRGAFVALTGLVRQSLADHPSRVLSLLSLPCSTGEEPYSMAMALLDASVPPDRFRVDAVDISGRNVAQGVRAVYGKNSFRGHQLGFRDRHFGPSPAGYVLRDTVRRQVRFQQGNLFDKDFLPGLEIYHVIFCRNVLIYFDTLTQDRTLTVLNRLLHAAGVLFVAPSETALPPRHGMVSTNEALAFAFRRSRVRATPTRRTIREVVAHPAPGPVLSVRSAAHSAGAVAASPREALPAHARPGLAVDSRSVLDEAIRLADLGHLVEAAVHCEDDLRRRGPSAEAFHLMGLVREAAGSHVEAATCYRKALYLDPNHHRTLIHLALLLERQHDRAGALVLRNRARRLELASKPHG